MLLKKLELQGFKSFPDKTVLTFDRGSTVVIGPNGSGKSNISDAMKWVLGELSSRNLRGTRMEDVIFGGTDTRRQMGYAEVSVTFDNTDTENGRLLCDYDEVTVTRRYYRAGESEYYINKKPVRLKDIHELFMNTGVGREGYSIIGQGRIAEIISQKSEDRRVVFEEAAGISKYRFKKAEAEKKLLSVEDNLVRVNDILSELSGRVGPLEKEAEKARIYLGMYERKKELDVSLWLWSMRELNDRITALEREFLLSRGDYDRADEELTDLENRSDRLAELSGENKEKTERLGEELAAANEEKLRLESDIKLAENEIFHIDERLTQNADAQKERAASLEAAKTELAALSAECDRLAGEVATAEDSAAKDAETVDAADRALDLSYRRISELEDAIAAADAERTEQRVALSVLENTKETQKRQKDELTEEITQLTEDTETLSARAEKADEAIRGYGEKLKKCEEEQAGLQADAAAAEEEKTALAEKQNDLYLAFREKKNRIEALSRMEELFEGYSRSVRSVMNDYKAKKLDKKVVLYGPVSQLITVRREYATAVETAFGANIQNIVVADEYSAKAAIRYLKDTGGGRATFYPLTTVKFDEKLPDLSRAEKMNGYIGVASELVSFDGQYGDVIRSMIGKILVTDNIESAAAVAAAYQYRIRVVTLDGQQVNAGGSFTGGSLRHDSGILTRGAEIEGLRGECRTLTEQIDEAKDGIAEIDERLEELGRKMSASNVSAQMLRTLSSAESTQAEVLRSQIEGDRARLEELQLKFEQMNADSEAYKNEHARLEQALADAEAKGIALTADKAAAEAARDEAARALTDAQKQQSRGQVALTALRKDAENAESRAASVRITISAAEETIRHGGEESEKLGEKRESLTRDILAAQKATVACTEAIAEKEEERKSLLSQNVEYEQKSGLLRTQIREKNHEKELLYRQYTKAEAKHGGAVAERDRSTAAMWDEYELTESSAEALGYPPITEENLEECREEQTKMKNRLKSLGTVHVGAIEEYAEVKERYDFLTAQVNDLNASKEELAGIVYRLESEMRTRFSECFEQINTEFKRVFRELFGGGHAELILTEPDDVLNSGIQINVAPPGKIIKNLMLLSGGEQAFVAIALYFALLCVNPAPFCILDEIEAALDEVNVDKFAAYLKRHSDKTQFIVITHRRGTMEQADRLYGVTMQEKGISTILSIDLSEVGNYINT